MAPATYQAPALGIQWPAEIEESDILSKAKKAALDTSKVTGFEIKTDDFPANWTAQDKAAAILDDVNAAKTKRAAIEAKKQEQIKAKALADNVLATQEAIRKGQIRADQAAKYLLSKGIDPQALNAPPQELAAAAGQGNVVGGVIRGATEAAGASGGNLPAPRTQQGGVYGALQGQMLEANRQAEEQTRGTPEQISEAYAAQRKAIEDSALLGEQKAAEIARYQEVMSDKQKAMQAKADDQLQSKRDAIENARGRYQLLQTQISNKEIEPRRLLKGGGAKIIAALSIALGEFGRALTGGNQNAALEIINKAIDDDIAAQQADIAKTKDTANMQGNLIAMLKEEYGTMQEATEAAKFALRQDLIDTIGRLNLEYEGPEKAVQAQQIVATLSAQQAQATEEYADRQLKRREQAIGTMADIQSRKEAGQIQRDQLALQRAATGAPEKEAAATEQRTKEALAAVDDLERSFKEKTGGMSWATRWLDTWFWNTDASDFDKQRETLAIGIAARIAKNNGARFNPDIVKMVRNQLPTAADTKSDAADKLKNVRKLLLMGGGGFVAGGGSDTQMGLTEED